MVLSVIVWNGSEKGVMCIGMVVVMNLVNGLNGYFVVCGFFGEFFVIFGGVFGMSGCD